MNYKKFLMKKGFTPEGFLELIHSEMDVLKNNNNTDIYKDTDEIKDALKKAAIKVATDLEYPNVDMAVEETLGLFSIEVAED